MAEYIDREVAVNAIKKDVMGGLNYESILKRIPSADVQPAKHGKWLTEYEPDGKPYCFHCSVCDSDFSIVGNKIAYDYCPDCGAKMDGEA